MSLYSTRVLSFAPDTPENDCHVALREATRPSELIDSGPPLTVTDFHRTALLPLFPLLSLWSELEQPAVFKEQLTVPKKYLPVDAR